MGKKKKILMYEMYCEVCKKPAVKDEGISTENWNVIPLICSKCGGRIKIDFDKPYYKEN